MVKTWEHEYTKYRDYLEKELRPHKNFPDRSEL